MRARKVYACEGCGIPVIRSNRTDRRRYCTPCAIEAAARAQAASHEAALRRRAAPNIVYLPDLVTADTGRIA